MIYRLIFFVLLIPVSLRAHESYYEDGRSDGTDLARHLQSLIAKDTVYFHSDTGAIIALRETLKREPVGTYEHAKALKGFKAYYTGFYEAFTQHGELDKAASLKTDLKEWIQTLSTMTREICVSGINANTFNAADLQQCDCMKQNIKSFLTRTRPKLELPIENIVVPMPTNPYYIRGRTIGCTLLAKLIEERDRHPAEIVEKELEPLNEILHSKESSTREHKQAFSDMKQFFVGLKERFMPYTTAALEASCRAHHLPENLIGLCKRDHDYISAATQIILGSTSVAQATHAGEKLERYYESVLMEDWLRQDINFEELNNLACSIEDGLIFEEFDEH